MFDEGGADKGEENKAQEEEPVAVEDVPDEAPAANQEPDVPDEEAEGAGEDDPIRISTFGSTRFGASKKGKKAKKVKKMKKGKKRADGGLDETGFTGIPEEYDNFDE
jgi:hypothetical protein